MLKNRNKAGLVWNIAVYKNTNWNINVRKNCTKYANTIIQYSIFVCTKWYKMYMYVYSHTLSPLVSFTISMYSFSNQYQKINWLAEKQGFWFHPFHSNYQQISSVVLVVFSLAMYMLGHWSSWWSDRMQLVVTSSCSGYQSTIQSRVQPTWQTLLAFSNCILRSFSYFTPSNHVHVPGFQWPGYWKLNCKFSGSRKT